MADYYLSPVVDGETFEPLVKVGDTLEIGTEVYFDGAEVPEGWEEVTDPVGDLTDLDTTIKTDLVSAINEVNSLVTPVTLYNGSTTDNSITLSDNINNYKYYEIVFHRGNGYSSVKMPTTILSNISLTTCQYASDLFRMYNANISISGTTLTKNYARYVNFTSNSCSSSDDTSNFYIDKVIGYK